ncbi:MAG: rhomboid family intramembrane serine protease [Nanoarchaeota archaeon]|nr:rhomboid family intramembrane serine protease [Nanoarchaeota archaeon]
MKYVALWLTGICVVMFILQTIFPIVTDIFVLVSSEVVQRPWILVTSMFLHGGADHLIYNMFALALFGSILEKIIGGKKFIILYFIAGLLAGLGSVPFYAAALGASGAIMGVLGCLAVLRPRMRVYVGYVPMPMVIATIVWIGGDLIGMFAPDQVAHAAHLFGMAFGIIFGLYYMKQFVEKHIKRKIGTLPENQVRKWEDRWL